MQTKNYLAIHVFVCFAPSEKASAKSPSIWEIYELKGLMEAKLPESSKMENTRGFLPRTLGRNKYRNATGLWNIECNERPFCRTKKDKSGVQN